MIYAPYDMMPVIVSRCVNKMAYTTHVNKRAHTTHVNKRAHTTRVNKIADVDFKRGHVIISSDIPRFYAGSTLKFMSTKFGGFVL